MPMMREPDRDCVSREAVRIAPAVVTLVVVTNCQSGLLRAFEFRRGQDSLPHLRVLFHFLALAFVELRSLQEDAVGYSDLADIVERGGNPENAEFFAGHATTHPNGLAEAKHTIGMTSRQRIAVTKRNRQRPGVGVQSNMNGFIQLHISAFRAGDERSRLK